MVLVSLVAALALKSQTAPTPVLWLTPEGKTLVAGKPYTPRVTKGATTVETPFGLGLDLDGTRGGLLLPDLPSFGLADSVSISTWIYLRAYVKDGPGAQVLFRGDDRNGLDPYQLVIHSDGRIVFGIIDVNNGVDQVQAPVPLKKWIHVTGSFNAEAAEMKLYLDGRVVDTSTTERQPMRVLSKSDAPGVSIGNIQNDKGPHNQPLDGIVADVRLYDAPVKPEQAGYRPYSG